MSSYCAGSGGWNDSDEHKWMERELIKESLGEPMRYFSLQKCKQCGECRKVEYVMSKE